MLTEIPGSSDVVERGFVTYSNEAKAEMLGVSAGVDRRARRGQREVAARHGDGRTGAFPRRPCGRSDRHRRAGRRHAGKPVGLVHFAALAAAAHRRASSTRERRYGDLGRGGGAGAMLQSPRRCSFPEQAPDALITVRPSAGGRP